MVNYRLISLALTDVADKRELRQFKETPEQRFALEQKHLQPLPDTDFDTKEINVYEPAQHLLCHQTIKRLLT